ncbi:hypothetical protein niasHS_000273 [Heterodera schachtii]|uniref:C2H2-type domain-containing protein n=1 Tax=Heterodera schachtii TaxID=97005 RepID=A0ABD2KL19_HETSC
MDDNFDMVSPPIGTIEETEQKTLYDFGGQLLRPLLPRNADHRRFSYFFEEGTQHFFMSDGADGRRCVISVRLENSAQRGAMRDYFRRNMYRFSHDYSCDFGFRALENAELDIVILKVYRKQMARHWDDLLGQVLYVINETIEETEQKTLYNFGGQLLRPLLPRNADHRRISYFFEEVCAGGDHHFFMSDGADGRRCVISIRLQNAAQLLGMPQTVISIAIHPEMQKQFAVRPLLIDQTMAVSHSPQQKQNGRHSGGGTVPKHIGIGLLPTEDNGTTSGGNPSHQLDNVDDNYQFQLPLAFRSSLVHPPTTTAQNVHHHQLLQQPQLNATIPSMECVSVIHPKMEQQFSASVDQFVDGDDDQCKTEPLDLSLSSARTKANENGTMGGNGATVAGGIQRRKRTTNKRQMAEEMCETTATGRKAMRKVTSTEAEQKRTSPPSAVGISLPPSVVPPSGTLFTPIASPSSAVSVVPSVVVSSKGPSSACATVSLPVLSPAVDSASRKRFLCDLCGDVSFLAMETLIGHKKYYCRNRLRPDDTSNSSPGANRTTPNGQLAEASHVSLGLKPIANSSSSSPPSASPPLVQCPHCPFQTATNALLGHHQKQQHSLPVVCAECGYRAFTVRGLRTHARLSHIGATSVVATEQITPNKKTMAKGNETKNENATTERLKGTDE